MGIYAVTGGASGIGAAVVANLRTAGHQVLIADLKNSDVNADLSTPDGRIRAVEGLMVLAPEGLDGLIPCAGVSGIHSGSLVASLNYFGVIETITGLQGSLAMRNGAVVLISSITASMPSPDDLVEAMLDHDEALAVRIAEQSDGNAVYGAGKRAITCWMRRNCAAWLQQGVRMNAVGPGYIDTPLNDEIRATEGGNTMMDEFVASIPVGRAGRAEDVAALVEFLLSDRAGFIAGNLVFVDGGHDALFRQDTF